MVSGWFDEEFEVVQLFDGPTEEARFDVRFRIDNGGRVSFLMEITLSNLRNWDPEHKVDFIRTPRRLASALLDHGAAEMPHERYRFDQRGPTDLESTLIDIAKPHGLGRYAAS